MPGNRAGGPPLQYRRRRIRTRSCPAGRNESNAIPTPGRARPAAHPHTELVTIITVPLPGASSASIAMPTAPPHSGAEQVLAHRRNQGFGILLGLCECLHVHKKCTTPPGAQKLHRREMGRHPL